MIELIGYRESYTPSYDGPPEVDEESEIVATFDTEEQAMEYIAKSKLKNPVKGRWSSDKVFKSSSLLGRYSWTDIRTVYEPITPPHNPEI